MHYDICIMYTIRIQMRVLQQFVQSGKCGKTSQLTAGCDSVNSSLRAKKRFAEFTEMIWNGKLKSWNGKQRLQCSHCLPVGSTV